MSANVGFATLNIIPSAKGFGAALRGEIDPAIGPIGDDAGRKTGSSLLSGFKGLLAVGMVTAGVSAMTNFVKGTISAASDLQQTTGAVEAVFKDQANSVKSFAADAAGSIGLSKSAYQELATVLGTQLKNGGTALADIAPKTRDLIGVGADLSAMFGGTTKDAVEALSAALKGERDPIERYGVSLSQARIDAEAAALGFEKVGGTYDATAQQAATLSLITKQTADAHGAAAREADTFASRQQQLSAGWENIKAAIGSAFLPAAAGAVGLLADLVNGAGPLAQTIGPALASTFGFLGPIIQELGGAIFALLPNLSPLGLAFQTLAPLLPQIGDLLAQIAGVIAEVLTVAAQALQPVMEALTTHLTGVLAMILPIIADLFGKLAPVLGQAASAVGEVVAAIAPLIATLLDTLIPIIESLMPLVKTVFGFIADIVTTVMKLISGIITAVMQAIRGDWSGAWNTIGKTLSDAWDGMLSAIGKAIEGVVKWFAGLLPAILSAISGIGSWLIDRGRDLVTGLFNGIKALWQNVGAWFASVPGIVGGWVSGAGQWLWDAGRNIVQGLLNGLASLAGTVGSFFLNLLPGWIREPFKAALGIHSPSRVFAGFGVNIGQGLINGMDSMSGDVATSALGLATAAHDAVDGIGAHLNGTASIASSIPEGGLAGALGSARTEGSSTTLTYTQVGGQGLTSEQELVVAARRLQHPY